MTGPGQDGEGRAGRRFEGRTIVITGGGSGIGAATARRVAGEGAHVVVVDRDEAAGTAVSSELSEAGAESTFLAADLSDRGEIARLCRRIDDELEAVHGLVNNAGIVRQATLEELSEADWDLQLAVNLTAPTLLVRGLVEPLARGRAAIVNVSSEGAFRARDRHAAYDASKAGIAALTRNFAVELADRQVRANSIAPGWVATEMHFGTGPGAADRREQLLHRSNPDAVMNRLARPEEIAAAIAFLLSDDSSYMTGSCLHVDGGMGLG